MVSQDVIQKNLYFLLPGAIHMFKVVEQQKNYISLKIISYIFLMFDLFVKPQITPRSGTYGRNWRK